MKSKYNDKALLTKLYQQYGNGGLIAEAIGVHRTIVYRWLKNYGITNRKICHHTVQTDYFKNIDSDTKAYWLGFLMADGCIYKGPSKNSYIMQINLKKSDICILKNLNKAIKSTYPIREYKVNHKDKQYDAVSLSISNTEFCLYLISHGIVPRKSVICTLPDLRPNLIRHFFRGYFDGDGCITKPKNKAWSFNIVGGESILSSFQAFLKEYNVTTYIYDINHSKAKSLETQNLQSIEIIFHILYDNTKTFLKRKKEIFNNAHKAYLSRLAAMQGQ